MHRIINGARIITTKSKALGSDCAWKKVKFCYHVHSYRFLQWSFLQLNREGSLSHMRVYTSHQGGLFNHDAIFLCIFVIPLCMVC